MENMWKQAVKDRSDGGTTKVEEQIDTQGDSGFLSGSNLMSSELSIGLESEERIDQPKVAPEPARATDSGLDFGLSDSLSQLSLKGSVLNPLDSGNIHPDIEELTSAEFKNEELQEPWEIYYTQDDDDGDTQLHISIVQGFLEAAFFLISIAPHPCLLNILNDDWQTALHLAVLTHQPKIVRRLILAGADPTVRNFRGNTPLHLACASGDLNCAQALINPITAAERTWLKVGKEVPSLPQNLEQRNYEGQTCLHVSASKGHVELVRQLIRSGADLEAREGLSGRTALHLAIEHRRRQVALYLIRECRPQLDAPTYAGSTAYHLACDVDAELAKELVRLGAKPSMPPDLFEESDSDEDDEEDGPDSTDYLMTLARLGIAPKSAPAIATV